MASALKDFFDGFCIERFYNEWKLLIDLNKFKFQLFWDFYWNFHEATKKVVLAFKSFIAKF